MRAFLRRVWARTRDIWRRARNERASPREIGFAVGIGVFAGCTPALGFHGPAALALATLLRLNRLWAWLGSRVANVVTLPFIVYAEVQVSHHLRTGAWMTLDREHVLEQWRSLLLDWMIGLLPVGGGLGLALGLLAFLVSTLRSRPRREADLDAPPPEQS